jgi:YidC/Oxa1 family membrane protein insertase
LWQALVNGIVSILDFLYNLTVSIGIPSYALAIFLLTVLIKLVLYPLTHKQMYSMKKMQEIQPKLKEIQEKHKGNQEKANQAVMELYKKNNVNPMSGCLPLLIQMPILLALFQALRQFKYADLGASFFWIPHLKNPDPYFIIPIVVGLTTYLQSKVTTPATKNDDNPQAASMQKMMLYFMPIFIGYMSVKFPAGLGIYWISFSILGTIQQVLINRQPAVNKGEVGGAK